MTTTTTATPNPDATGTGTGGGTGSSSSNAAPDPRAQGGLDVATVSSALRLLHGDTKESVIELRAISAGQNKSVMVGFFGQLPYLCREIQTWDGRMQLYVGIQPRHSGLLGRANNHLALRVEGAKAKDIWVITSFVIDIDPVRPKGEAATDAELARAMEVAQRIRDDFVAMGWPGPIRVMSGNGTHIVFCFPPVHIRDDAHRAEVAAMLRAFEAFIQIKYTVDGIGIDTISDLPRILKLAGTMSVKGANTPERPWRRSYFIDPPVRVENPLFWAFVEALPKVEEKKTKSTNAKSVDDADIVIGDKPSARVMQAVMANKNTRAHWGSRGKPVMNSDGSPGDCTDSGYDFTVVVDLAHAGITDPSELATAIANRPNPTGKPKSRDYVVRTVLRALAVAVKQKDEDEEGNFEVFSATKTSSNPKLFRLVTSLGDLELGAEHFVNERRFNEAFMNAFGLLPVLSSEDADRPWSDVVNGWLADADIIVLPPEASTEFAMRARVYAAVIGLEEGKVVDDLDSRTCLVVDGKKVFKGKTIEDALNVGALASTRVTSHEVCNALIKLGCTKVSPRLGPNRKRIRLFEAPDMWPRDVTGADAVSDADPRQLMFPFMMVEQVDA